MIAGRLRKTERCGVIDKVGRGQSTKDFTGHHRRMEWGAQNVASGENPQQQYLPSTF